MRQFVKVTSVAAALGLAGFGFIHAAKSADHIDSASVEADPSADINDVYSWVDGANMVLVMTVSPVATVTSKFSDQVKYVFHTKSGAAFGATTTNYDIICSFDAAQAIQCWGGTNEYVKGSASAATGLTSTDGKFKVFAGLRADPFFFNLDGFRNAVASVKLAAAEPPPNNLVFDAAGCPRIDSGTSIVLFTQLKTNPDGSAPVDFFANLNTLSIVVSIDKTLINAGGPIVSVSAATYK